MKFTLLITLLCINISCESRKNEFQIYGLWQDINCYNVSQNCNTKYAQIEILENSCNSFRVKEKNGGWLNKESVNKWQSIAFTLENGYETLLFPNYSTQNLQYYDNQENRFIYYKKISK